MRFIIIWKEMVVTCFKGGCSHLHRGIEKSQGTRNISKSVEIVTPYLLQASQEREYYKHLFHVSLLSVCGVQVQSLLDLRPTAFQPNLVLSLISSQTIIKKVVKNFILNRFLFLNE